MKTTKSSIINLVIGVLLMGSVITNVLLFVSNDSLYKEKNIEIIKFDSVLSVKLLLDKEIEVLNAKLSNINNERSNLNTQLKDFTEKLKFQKNEIENLIIDNKNFKTLKQQLSDLRKLNKDLDFKLNTILIENDGLKGKYNMISISKEDLQNKITSNLELLKQLKVDNIFVEKYKIKKNNRLVATNKAKYVKKITVSFDFFANGFATQNEKTVHLIISDSNGNIFSLQDAVFKTAENNFSKYTSMQVIKFDSNSKPYTIHFDLNSKLTSGLYNASIYVDGFYSGKGQFNLY